jgi:hypothetical protein
MSHVNGPRSGNADLLDALQAVGALVARLPYGVVEPVLCGTAATSLYTAGLWRCAEMALWMAEPLALTAALTAEGFRPDDSGGPGEGGLRRPDLRCTLRVARGGCGVGPAIATNTVRVGLDLDAAAIFERGLFSIRVIGIEDLIADQIVGWLRKGGRQGEAAVLSQVLIELGRMGAGGPFRHAYLQRRLDRETNGEAIFELPHTASPLDDLAPRHTSLTAIASVVNRWRIRRGLSNDVDENAPADAPHTAQSCLDRCRNDLEERRGQSSAPGARIIPFPINRAHQPRNSGG